MGQNKLERFAAIKTFPNVLEYPQGMAGQWHQHFGNTNPITLELACGKGEYAVGLGRLYPERNFIGVDVKGNRLWRGATIAMQDGLKNVAFIRSQIDFLTYYFAPGEVAEIWITFADPQLEKPRKRLTSPYFLPRFKEILNAKGLVHLKTDSPELYQYTLSRVAEEKLNLQFANDNIYSLPEQMPEWEIKTYYEQMHLDKGLTIKYLRFEI